MGKLEIRMVKLTVEIGILARDHGGRPRNAMRPATIAGALGHICSSQLETKATARKLQWAAQGSGSAGRRLFEETIGQTARLHQQARRARHRRRLTQDDPKASLREG